MNPPIHLEPYLEQLAEQIEADEAPDLSAGAELERTRHALAALEHRDDHTHRKVRGILAGAS